MQDTELIRYSLDARANHTPVISAEDDNWWLVASNPAYQVTIPSSSSWVDMDIVDYDWVGKQDQVDFRQIRVDMAGEYTFHLTGLSNKATLTVYNNSTKKIEKISAKAGKDGHTKGMFLQAGVYYISVDAPGWKKNENTEYNVTVTGQVFNRGNNHDDVAANLGPAYYVTISNTNPAVSQTLIANDWVGYGDSIDYRKITIESPGQYSFLMEGLTGKAKLTLYSANLKKITSVSAKAGKTGLIKERFLYAGTYYISVAAPDWKKGKSSEYNVTVTGVAYNRGNNADDTPGTATNLDLSTGVLSDWVGFGDAIDYRKFTLTQVQNLHFVMTGASGMAKMTLYRLESGKLKTIQKATTLKKDIAQWNNLQLGPGDYYLAVESADKGKGKKNTDYSLNISGYHPPVAATAASAFSSDGVDLGNWQQLPEVGYVSASLALTDTIGSDSIAGHWGKLIG